LESRERAKETRERTKETRERTKENKQRKRARKIEEFMRSPSFDLLSLEQQQNIKDAFYHEILK
jgi:hypothetical protein